MRLRTTVLCIMLVSSAGAGFGLAQESMNPRLLQASILVERGGRALSVGNLNKADSNFAKALKILPDLPEAHLGQGRVLMARLEFWAALEAFLQAEECYLQKTASLLELHRERYAAAQARASDLHRRLSILRENIARHEALSGDASGRSAERQKNIGANLQVEVRGIEVELDRLGAMPAPPPPTDDGVPGEVYFLLGNALNRLDRVDAAVKAWEICAERSPGHSLVYNNLAAGYLKLDRPDRARASLDRARLAGVRINPTLEAEVVDAADAGPSSDSD